MYPGFFSDDNDLEYYANLQRQIILECSLLINQTEDQKIIESIRVINNYFLNQIKPKNFNPRDDDNILIVQQRAFEELCSLLESNGVSNPRNKSVVEVYARLTYFKKKNAATKTPKNPS